MTGGARYEPLRAQLLDGLSPLVQGMAEALLLEWEAAVEAVPELAHVAVYEVLNLLRLDPAAREVAVRSRWARSTPG